MAGNSDFRSDEYIELLKQSDIVVANPPFSLFRETEFYNIHLIFSVIVLYCRKFHFFYMKGKINNLKNNIH